MPITTEEVPPVFQNNPGKTAEFVKLSEHPYTKDKGHASCPECRRMGLTKNISNTDEEDKLCPMHRIAIEFANKVRRERRKAKERYIKDKTNRFIPEEGLVMQSSKVKSGKVRIYRKSIRDITGHFTELELKELAVDIRQLIKSCQYVSETRLDPSSHNYQDKLNRGVTYYRYYKVVYHGYNLRINMELRDNEEVPYAINLIK